MATEHRKGTNERRIIEPSEGEVKLGEWNDNYDTCFEKADQEFIPIVTYWTDGCPPARTFETNALLDEHFIEW